MTRENNNRQDKVESRPLKIERIYNAPVEKVWAAITNLDEMRKWYFEIDKFKPKVGFKFQFDGKGSKGENYTHLCEITEVIYQKKLAYSWQYQGFEGNSLVTFELSVEGDKTKLTLTHAGLETFPRDKPDFANENFLEGWTIIIGTSLKDFVEK